MKLVDFDKLLPEDMPEGERVLWWGCPDWVSLARNAYRVDLVALYFVALAVWNAASAGAEAGSLAAVIAVARTFVLAVAGLGLLGLLAWLSARTTLYVVTSRRIVMKVGVALPIFFNLPYSQIASAALRRFSDGTGDIPLALCAGRRIAYLHLWPHARPFHFANPQPALRSIPQAELVASALREAMIAEAQSRLGVAGAALQPAIAAETNDQRFPSSIVTA